MPEGCLTRAAPDPNAAADIARGRAVLAALSPFDIGQAAVVIDGHVVAVEDIEGTDALLARVARLRKEGRIRASAMRGALVKTPKSGQDLRFDLPTVGPRTVEGAAAAGLAGIAAIAGNTIVVEAQTMIEAADAGGPVCRRSFLVMAARADVARKIFLIATEESGDRLGANLMKVLAPAARWRGPVRRRRRPVDGARGIALAVSDRGALDRRTGGGRRRSCRRTCDGSGKPPMRVLQAAPDILVIIDSPDFTHRVARQVGPATLEFRSSTSIALGRGPGGPAGRARCAPMSIMWGGAVAVRTGGISQAARPALQLCWSSPDRTDRLLNPIPANRRGAAKNLRSCWCCPEAAAARSIIIWRYSAVRWGS